MHQRNSPAYALAFAALLHLLSPLPAAETEVESPGVASRHRPEHHHRDSRPACRNDQVGVSSWCPAEESGKPFLLGKYEVTQGQYEAVMGRNPSTFKNGPDYPVEQMSWQDAKDFCAQLNAGLPADAKMNFRLPTDEEWSIAVGLPEEVPGTLKQKSKQDPGCVSVGHELAAHQHLWQTTATASNKKKYAERMSYVPGLDDGFADTSPVGVFPPNKAGLYDMGGNVWEWCEDFVDEKKNIHVVRGGRLVHRTARVNFCPPTAEFRPRAISPAASG